MPGSLLYRLRSIVEIRRFWLAVGGVLGGLMAGGCARHAVVPPTASISQPPVVALSPRIEPFGADVRVPAIPSPDIGDVQWPTDEPLRNWNYLVLHHTATDRGNVESIHETHLRRKDKNGNHWQGIGYHFVIGNGDGMADGEIEPTFRWRQQLAGAHAGVNEYNQQGIGVVLVGNFEKQPPTPAQMTAAKRLVGALSRRCRISAEHVIGHADIKATDCPGRQFPLETVRASAVASDPS